MRTVLNMSDSVRISWVLDNSVEDLRSVIQQARDASLPSLGEHCLDRISLSSFSIHYYSFNAAVHAGISISW
jgi:hypothetical protein